jgi:hypothetical protein
MRTETTRDATTRYVLQHPPSLTESIEPDISRRELPASRSDPPPAHDATLLVMALEDLEAQRVAIEWLLDADLLCACLL